jgi:hypothetical protein
MTMLFKQGLGSTDRHVPKERAAPTEKGLD